jgi:hypothetical protein
VRGAPKYNELTCWGWTLKREASDKRREWPSKLPAGPRFSRIARRLSMPGKPAARTPNVIGTCTAPFGAISAVTFVTGYYPGGPATTQQLKEACEAGINGTWVTP